MIFSIRSKMISRRYSLGQRTVNKPVRRLSSSSSSTHNEYVRRTQSMDSNEIQVTDWIDRSIYTIVKGTTPSENESENDCAVFYRSSEDDLKLGAEAIPSDLETPPAKPDTLRLDNMYNLRSQDSESSWTSNLTCSSNQSRVLKSLSQLGNIATVEGVYSALDSLPMTATDILYNLGFAASGTTSQVPTRFLQSPTNAYLGDWNGRVYWADQTTPVSNFDYLFNMMDDTPAMEEEVIEDSVTDGSFKSAFTSRPSSTTSLSSTTSSQPCSPQPTNTTATFTSTSVGPVKKFSGRPKFVRSRSLPESSTTSSQQKKEEKHFPKMKLRRHRSQLCLQQSFDTITEEEEEEKGFEKLETIKGSFNISVDSCVTQQPVTKPSTQCSASHGKVEETAEVDNDITAVSRTSSIEKKNGAKLKRQSCEEFFQETQETLNWDDLKVKLEEVERRAWNMVTSSSTTKRKKFSKLRETISLPSYGSERISPLTLRRCITICPEETETETSESDLSSFSNHNTASLASETLSNHNTVSVPRDIIISRSETDILEPDTPGYEDVQQVDGGNPNQVDPEVLDPKNRTNSESSEMSVECCRLSNPTITVEQIDLNTTDRHNVYGEDCFLLRPQLNSDCDRPTSPALSFTSESTLIPDIESETELDTDNQRENAHPIELPGIQPREMTSLYTTKCEKQSRLRKMKSTQMFSSLNIHNYKSPFYIRIPKLRHRKRSSSLPLLYRPALIKSKLRRTVTDNPNTLSNVIEEYDADLDDEDLQCEQEEWENRIYKSILKSFTSRSSQALLKRIEERVEGNSDEILTVQKSPRRRKTSSFSNPGDNPISSSTEGVEKSELLEVKPRRKRRKSREKVKPEQEETLVSTFQMSLNEQSKTEEMTRDSKSPFTLPSHVSTSDYAEERMSDIIKQDKHVGGNDSTTCSSQTLNLPDDVNTEQWEIQVLQNVIQHFESDFLESEKLLEKKRKRDKQIRMEIKMLKTQLAVYKMEQMLSRDKSHDKSHDQSHDQSHDMSENFCPQLTSTPRGIDKDYNKNNNLSKNNSNYSNNSSSISERNVSTNNESNCRNNKNRNRLSSPRRHMTLNNYLLSRPNEI